MRFAGLESAAIQAAQGAQVDDPAQRPSGARRDPLPPQFRSNY